MWEKSRLNTHTPRSPDSPLTLTCKVQSLLHICVVSHADTAAAAGTSSIFTTMSLSCYQLKQPAAAGESRVLDVSYLRELQETLRCWLLSFPTEKNSPIDLFVRIISKTC